MSPKCSCFFSKTSYKKYEKLWNCFGPYYIIDSLRDLFERMLRVISCHTCVWHNFGNHVSKDVVTNSPEKCISQVVRTILGHSFHFCFMALLLFSLLCFISFKSCWDFLLDIFRQILSKRHFPEHSLNIGNFAAERMNCEQTGLG